MITLTYCSDFCCNDKVEPYADLIIENYDSEFTVSNLYLVGYKFNNFNIPYGTS